MGFLHVYIYDDRELSGFFGKLFEKLPTFIDGQDKFSVRSSDPEYKEVFELLNRLCKNKTEREEKAKLCELKRKYGDIEC